MNSPPISGVVCSWPYRKQSLSLPVKYLSSSIEFTVSRTSVTIFLPFTCSTSHTYFNFSAPACLYLSLERCQSFPFSWQTPNCGPRTPLKYPPTPPQKMKFPQLATWRIIVPTPISLVSRLAISHPHCRQFIVGCAWGNFMYNGQWLWDICPCYRERLVKQLLSDGVVSLTFWTRRLRVLF